MKPCSPWFPVFLHTFPPLKSLQKGQMWRSRTCHRTQQREGAGKFVSTPKRWCFLFHPRKTKTSEKNSLQKQNQAFEKDYFDKFLKGKSPHFSSETIPLGFIQRLPNNQLSFGFGHMIFVGLLCKYWRWSSSSAINSDNVVKRKFNIECVYKKKPKSQLKCRHWSFGKT